ALAEFASGQTNSGATLLKTPSQPSSSSADSPGSGPQTRLAETKSLTNAPLQSGREELVAEIDRIKRWLQTNGTPPLGYLPRIEVPGVTHVLFRGEPDKPRDEVMAGGLSSVDVPGAELGLS